MSIELLLSNVSHCGGKRASLSPHAHDLHLRWRQPDLSARVLLAIATDPAAMERLIALSAGE